MGNISGYPFWSGKMNFLRVLTEAWIAAAACDSNQFRKGTMVISTWKLCCNAFCWGNRGVTTTCSPGFSFLPRCLFGLPPIISCRNPYIEHGWTWYIVSDENSQLVVGCLLWTSNCILLMKSIVKNVSIRETYFFPQFWSKSYWRSVFLRVFACILFCSYPCLSFSFDACLGCRQLSAAETHT